MSNSEISVVPVVTQLRPYPQSIAPNKLVCNVTHNSTKATVTMESTRDHISYCVEVDSPTAEQTTMTYTLAKGVMPKTSSHVQVTMTDDAIAFNGVNVKSEVVDNVWVIKIHHPTFPVAITVFNTLVPTVESDGQIKE